MMRKTTFILIFIVFVFMEVLTSNIGAVEKNNSVSREMVLARQYFEKGKLSGSENKYDEALEYFLKAEPIMPDDEELIFFIGLTFRHLGRYEDALKYFQRVLEINPYSVPAIGNIADINRNLKQFPEAIEAFHRILDLKPTDEVAMTNLADIHFKLKEYEDCHNYIMLYKKTIENKNIYLLTQRDQEHIKNTLNRFEVYTTVINNETSKKDNKVKSSF